MVAKDGFQKYLDAGLAFTNLTRARAEELVQELVKNGEFQSGDAKAKVEELIERSRKGREAIVAQVRHEVTRQLEGMGITSLEDLAQQVATVIGRTADAGRAASSGSKAATTKAAAKKAPAAKSTAKKTPATKTPTKKAAAKKAPAAKSAAKKAAAKKAPAAKTPAQKAPAATSAATTEPPTDILHPGSAD
jgi:polyhydroxyalkanoate synthesis regulator phasin